MRGLSSCGPHDMLSRGRDGMEEGKEEGRGGEENNERDRGGFTKRNEDEEIASRTLEGDGSKD
eukprot:753101-Hanusia_phi.AAC.3